MRPASKAAIPGARARKTDEARILVVDDHALLRDGLVMLIEDESGLTVCGTAGSADEALQRLEALAPDLVTLDLSMPGMGGLELIKHVKARFPETCVLVVTMHKESAYAERCLRAGAEGYVMKKDPPEVLIEGIRRVLRGEVAVSPALTAQMLRRVSRGAAQAPTGIDALTDRELEVFEMLGQGAGTRGIADQLNLSIKTIHYYREAIKQKLGLKDAAELTHRAYVWAHSTTSSNEET